MSPRRKTPNTPPDDHAQPHHDASQDPITTPDADWEITVIRSARRKKTVSARMINWYTLEVRAPAHLPDRELEPLIQRLVDRADKRRRKFRNFASDDELQRRAQALNTRYFEGKLRWRSIRFVGNQTTRFGSCSPGRGTIRISDRIRGVPSFVLDYVIVHELAHLLEANHSDRFWELVNRYPRAERARGYLMALQLDDEVSDDALDPDV